jgi:hypothetical protein
MAANFYGAILAFTSCFAVTAILSSFTSAKSREELADLTCWTGTQLGVRIPKATYALALVALVICIILGILFR